MLDITKYGCLLHKKWTIKNETTVEGYWAEDDSAFELNVPSQLAPTIVDLQNELSTHYNNMQKIKTNATNIVNSFEEFTQSVMKAFLKE